MLQKPYNQETPAVDLLETRSEENPANESSASAVVVFTLGKRIFEREISRGRERDSQR